MQDKLIEILSAATGWMTATELADKGKWRSAAHVGLALKQMPNVEHRTSPTKKTGNGMPAKEYKLVDKVFPDDLAYAKGSKSVVKKSPTAAPVPAPSPLAHDNEQADLRAKLKLAEEQRNDHFNRAEQFQAALEKVDKRLGIIGTMLINIDGESIEQKLGKVMHERIHAQARIDELQKEVGNARIQIGALNEQLMHEDAAVDVKDAAKGYLVCAPKRKPAKVTKAESAVARAKSAAKSASRSEVFALVPVGVATRKQVKAVEFKERSA